MRRPSHIEPRRCRIRPAASGAKECPVGQEDKREERQDDNQGREAIGEPDRPIDPSFGPQSARSLDPLVARHCAGEEQCDAENEPTHRDPRPTGGDQRSRYRPRGGEEHLLPGNP